MSVDNKNIVDNRNVLVIVVSENCGACKQYKSNKGLDQLMKDIQVAGIVRSVLIEKKAMRDPIDLKYPQQLNNLAVWYPTFILVNGKAWNQNFSESKNSELPVEVFNGIVGKDGIAQMSNDRKLFDKIVPWVIENVENNPKFKVMTATTPTITPKNVSEEKETKKIFISTCSSIRLSSYSRR